MKKNKRAAISLIWVLFFMCSSMSVSDNQGGAAETINAEVVYDSTSVRVRVPEHPDILIDAFAYEISYKPLEQIGFVDSTVFNGINENRWYGLPKGKYNLLLQTSDAKLIGMACGLRVGSAIRDSVIVLMTSGATLKGFARSLADSLVTSECRFAIEGSPFATLSDSSGRFIFDRLPQGLLTVTIRPGKRLLYPGPSRLTFLIENPGYIYKTVVRVPW